MNGASELPLRAERKSIAAVRWSALLLGLRLLEVSADILFQALACREARYEVNIVWPGRWSRRSETSPQLDAPER